MTRLGHAHGDHYGLLPAAHSALPVHLGEGALRLVRTAAPFVRSAAFPRIVTPYRHREAFAVGPFRITPYLMDHSGFDAYALLVEGGGHRLLYSGDLRAHGRKSWAFDAFVSKPPAGIDALLLEGTTFGRQLDSSSMSEAQLEDEIVASISATKACRDSS